MCLLIASEPPPHPVRTPSPSLFSFFPFSRAKATLSRQCGHHTQALSCGRATPVSSSSNQIQEPLLSTFDLFDREHSEHTSHIIVIFSLASLLRISSLKEIHRSTFDNMLFPLIKLQRSPYHEEQASRVRQRRLSAPLPPPGKIKHLYTSHFLNTNQVILLITSLTGRRLFLYHRICHQHLVEAHNHFPFNDCSS